MRLAIIGGTGIDEMDCFAVGATVSVCTRFGCAEIIEGRMGDQDIIFVPRHGVRHSIPPSAINYRAQIAALRKLEIDAVIGVCAVGSLTTDLPAGSFAVLSDFVDLTKRRIDTFFDSEGGPVVHTDLTEPYCPIVSDTLRRSCDEAGAVFEANSIYIGVEGPRYETPAEIRLYASWGGHVIGMTNLPEAILAREAGLCYGALAVVTNLASGLSPTRLSHEEVRAAMAASSERLKTIMTRALAAIPDTRECVCRSDNLST